MDVAVWKWISDMSIYDANIIFVTDEGHLYWESVVY